MLSQTGKGPRPRSADEHMLGHQDSYDDDCIEEVGEKSADISFREENSEERKNISKSKENLFHV